MGLSKKFVVYRSHNTKYQRIFEYKPKNDEVFFTDGVSMFAAKVSTMTEQRRKQEDFPSQSHIK
jgi:hypothetical protein